MQVDEDELAAVTNDHRDVELNGITTETER